MKISKQCSECQGTDIYQSEIKAKSDHTNLLPGINTLWSYPRLEIYVCGQCGHYQTFVPVDFLSLVAERFEKYS